MTSRKLELVQKQSHKSRTPRPEPMPEGPLRNYRKILVFSPDNDRLATVMEALSNCGHSCMFAKTLEQAKEHMETPEVGFIVADGVKAIQDLVKTLEAIRRTRPDIYKQNKYHVFTARYVSELKDTFERFGGGIQPLE